MPDRTFRGLVLGVTFSLAVLTLALLADPELSLATVQRDADFVLNTTAAIAALAVAALGWTRFRDRRQWSDVLEGGAFVPIALVGFVAVLAPIVGFDGALGLRLDDPGQLPLCGWVVARSACAVALIAGGWLAGRALTIGTRRASLLFFAPVTVTVLLLLAIIAMEDGLPPMLDEGGLAQLRRDPVVSSVFPGRTLVGTGAEIAVGVALLVGAGLYLRRMPPSAGPGRHYVGLGLVIAAFAQIHNAAYPGAFTSLVTAGDVLRLPFSLVLLYALQRDAAADLASLRQSNRELERLARSEGVRAAADERGRVAREFHDGLAQELTRARLKLGLLLERSEVLPETTALASDAASAIDKGLEDARLVVMALRAPDTGEGLAETLEAHVRRYDQELDVRTDLRALDRLPSLSATHRAELLRIVDEAMTNAVRHANATVVRVGAQSEPGWLHLTVADNGRGFDLDDARRAGFGLQTMRERAAAIDGRLAIATERRRGTTVTIMIPVPGGPA